MAALPPLRYAEALPRSADLVVIGGGIVGAATAYFAARAGLSTVVLEKRPALCTLTTPVSTGAFRLQFDNPEEIALVREGVELFERFAEVADLPSYDIGLTQQGYLFCTTDEAGMKQERIRMVVDLPAPLGPRNPTISPGATENETSRIAV